MANQNIEASPNKVERWGSCLAHGSALFIGAPLGIFLPVFPLFLLPCPVVAYMIARSFRRRKLAWGAFQGMQASAMQLLIVILATGINLAGTAPILGPLLATAAFLLFLYSLWGALDTALGYDFRYAGIGDLLDRVSKSNLARPEKRRRWFGGRGTDGE